MDGEQFTGLKAENTILNEENQALREELVELRGDVSKLHFELAKDPAQRYPSLSQKSRWVSEVSASDEMSAENQISDYETEDFNVWAGVGDVVSHAYPPAEYDSVNTSVDIDALNSRDCYARGEGLIGMFAAMTRKCPDWYLGDGIIIID